MDQHQTSREPSNKEILIEKEKKNKNATHRSIFIHKYKTRITQYIEIKRDLATNKQTHSIKTIKK